MGSAWSPARHLPAVSWCCEKRKFLGEIGWIKPQPNSCGKSPGRAAGTRIKPRKQFKVYRKTAQEAIQGLRTNARHGLTAGFTTSIHCVTSRTFASYSELPCQR